VSSIPPLEYVYWRSGAQPPSRGFQTTDTGPAIPLSVRPEGEPVEPPPESFPTLPERSPWRIWADFAALAAGLLPFVILELWSRRRRLSRPARRALACAEPMAALRRYLSERFDVPARAWVPSEVIPGLTAVGVPLALAERAAQLIEQAEIARFGDGPAPDAATARTLIVELEAWLWQRSSP
jgi:hypothetical protein